MRPFLLNSLHHGVAGHGPLYDVHARLSINGIDLESVLGFNPLVGATWSAQVDQLATSVDIRLALGIGSTSTSPFVGNSALAGSGAQPEEGARFALETATVAKSQPPSDWHTVVDGEFDKVAVQGNETILTGRDLMCLALDADIEPESDDTWGFWRDAETLHARVQAIQAHVAAYNPELNDLTFQTLSDPEWTVIGSWTDAGQTVAEAIHAVVLQRGWAMHYRYALNGGTTPVVAIYDPVRTTGANEYTLGHDEIIRFLQFAKDRTHARNVVRMRYSATRTPASTSDTASIDRIGRRFMQLGEEYTQEIDTSDEANRMLAAALADRKEPLYLVDFERFYMWNLELGDQLELPVLVTPRFTGLETTQVLHLAVEGYTHTLDFRPDGQMRTTVRTTGGAIAARRRWERIKQKMIHVSLDEPVGGAPSGAEWYQVDDLTPP